MPRNTHTLVHPELLRHVTHPKDTGHFDVADPALKLGKKYPTSPDVMPLQTMQAVNYVLGTWGFHPEAPFEDLIHMYGHSQKIMRIRAEQTDNYFGYGYDPMRHKKNGGTEFKTTYNPTDRGQKDLAGNYMPGWVRF